MLPTVSATSSSSDKLCSVFPVASPVPDMHVTPPLG